MLRVGRIVAWLAIAAAVIGAVMVLGVGPAYQMHMVDLGTALQAVLPIGVMIALGGLALAIIWGLLRIFSREITGTAMVIAATVIAIAVTALPLMRAYQLLVTQSIPPIHDITTDTDDPPQFVAALPLRSEAKAVNPPEYVKVVDADKGWRGMNELPAMQKAAYPDIQPIMSPKPPAELFADALNAADAMGWTVIDKNPIEGRIEATSTSLFFGFTDDIVIRIKPEGTGSRLDIRSKSRIGVSDIGANADRIRSFRSKLAP